MKCTAYDEFKNVLVLIRFIRFIHFSTIGLSLQNREFVLWNEWKSAVGYLLNIVPFSQSLYKAISGHGQPESYKQPAVLSDGQVWIPLGRAVFLEADFRTSEVGDTAMSVFKVRYNPYTCCKFT